jgi:hypothetical protein
MGTLRFADLETRPTEVLDLTSLTIEEFRELAPYALGLRDVSGPAHGQTWAGSLRVDRPAVAP